MVRLVRGADPAAFDPRLPAAFLQGWLEEGHRLALCTDPVLAWLACHHLDVEGAFEAMGVTPAGLYRACGTIGGMQAVADQLNLFQVREPEPGDVVAFGLADGDAMAGLQIAQHHVGAISRDGQFVTFPAAAQVAWSLRASRQALLASRGERR